MKLPFDRHFFFTTAFRSRFGKYTLYVAIISFIAHLILFVWHNYVLGSVPEGLLQHPINAIYTPFSFLLVYEAYLLLFYLQRSTTIYVGKQYEIIVLILIRGIFKDMTHLDLAKSNWRSMGNQELWLDLFTVLIVFGLILIFYWISNRFKLQSDGHSELEVSGSSLQQFVRAKKYLSVLLLAISLLLGVYSLSSWISHLSIGSALTPALDINTIFFDQFFTMLILADVLILLFSLFYTDDFAIIIRNSSFIISTILLKLSFAADSGMSQVFIIAGVAFGVTMSAITHAFIRLNKRGSGG